MNPTVRTQLAALTLVLAGIGLSNCGGGGSSSSTPSTPVATGSPPAPILIAGATYQYDGIESVVIAYASPSATNVNSTAAYTYVANQSVLASAAGAPAPFDINRVTTYTPTTAPVSGELLLNATTDTYESQSFSGATETIATAGAKDTTNGVDLSAALRLGGGPFNETSTATTTETTPVTDAVYPLVTGSSMVESLARTVTTVSTDANAGGTYGGGGTTAETYNGDGSYTRTFTATDGSLKQQQTVTSVGTASAAAQTATASTVTAIAVPTSSGGPSTIPVTVTNVLTGVVTNDVAADWYPGGAQPATPLAATTVTVVGPVALPSGCAIAGTAPAVIENSITTSNLNLLGAYTTSNEQLYNANGINICHTITTLTSNYNDTTGALTSTTTTTISEAIVASNQTILGVKRTVKH
jgi:hypothetical protein